MVADSPTFWQRITYAYGRRLPDHLQEWVRQDLTDDGAVRRHMIRYAIPPVFVLAPLWLLPASPPFPSASCSWPATCPALC